MRPGVAAGHPATAEVGAGDPRRGRNGRGRRRGHGSRLLRRRDGDERSPLRLSCDRLRRLARLERRRLRSAALGGGDLLDVSRYRSETRSSSTRSAPASCAVPGLPATLGELSERLGRLPWRRLVEPALDLARDGVPLPEMHGARSRCSRTSSSSAAAARSSLPRGSCSQAGQLLVQPGLVTALEMLAEEGAQSVYRGSLSEALLAVDGRRLHRRRPRGLRASLDGSRPRGLPRTSRRHARRALRGAGAPFPPSPPRGALRGRACPRAGRGARRDRDGRRAHDEHGRRRRSGPRVRPDPLARRRRRSLGARPRPAAEQPARRVGHRLRRARSPETTWRAGWRRASPSTTRA